MMFFSTIFLLFLNIIYSKDELCISESEKCPFSSDADIIQYFAKGIVPSESNETYFNTFLYCSFGYYNCGYINDEYGEEFYNSSGIMIASGIDLGMIKNKEQLKKEYNIDDNLAKKLEKFISVKGEKAADTLVREQGLFLQADEIDQINKKIYAYKEKEFYRKFQDFFPSNSANKTLLAFYVRYANHENIMKEFTALIESRQWDELSYYLLNFFPFEYRQRKILSQAFIFPEKKAFNRYHIGIFFDSKLNNKENEKKLLSFFSSFISNNDKLYDENKVFTIGNSTTVELEKKSAKEAKDCLSNYQYIYNESELIDEGLNEIANSMTNYEDSIFDSLYYQKILIIVLTNKIRDQRLTIDKIRKKGINVILLGNVNTNVSYSNLRGILGNEINLIAFEKYDELDKYKYDYVQLMESLIASQVEEFEFSITNQDKIEIKEMKTFQLNSFNYFKIKKEKRVQYHVSIKYNDSVPTNITMFISKENPYPDIINNNIQHFGLGVEEPFMNVLDKTSESFTIGIFGDNLDYSITVEKCSETVQCIETSNGLFGKVNATIQDNTYAAFRNCSYLQCPYSREELINKFFKGVPNYKNFNDNYFDWKIFHCLYKINTCAYFKLKDGNIDTESGVFLGHLQLNKYTEIDLLGRQYPQFMINLLYPFLQNQYSNDTILDVYNEYNLELPIAAIESIYVSDIKYKYSYINEKFSNACSRDLSTDFALLMHCYDTNQIKEEEVDALCDNEKKYIDSYIMKDYHNKDEYRQLQLEMQMILLQSSNIIKSEQMIVSFIVGKPLLYSTQFKEFIISHFGDYMISMSYFDTKTRTIKTLASFSDKIKDKLSEFKGDFTELDIFDINQALLQQLSMFNLYDYGFKKVIVFVSTKNEVNESKRKYDYNVTALSNSTLFEVKHLGINYIHFTSNSSYIESPEEEVIYFKSLSLLGNYSEILKNDIIKAPIPITEKSKLVFDLEENKAITYQFHYPKSPLNANEKDKREIKFQLDNNNVSIYFSERYPFPNKYINDKHDEDKAEKEEITFELDPNNINGTFYMSIEGKSKIDYMIVEIEECVNEQCEKRMNKIIIITSFIVGGLIVLLYGIYNCFCDSIVKKENNIFDR